MSFKDFIQNENVSKDTKLEDKIKKIVSDEIDYKNIKFDYNDNQMKVYITPEDKDEDCLILGKKLEKLFKNKIPGFMVYNDTKNKGSFTIDLSVETLKESENIALSEEVQMLMSERPSLIVKAGRLKKLRKFHKTSQFKNVIHKKNLRALKTAAGIKKKRAKKRYMKKYTRKYGKIMALRAKKYQNIVKESFNKINMYNNVKVKGLAFTYDISSCTFDDQDSAIIVVKKDNRDLAEKTESISKSFMEWLSDRYPYYIFSREIKRDQKDGYIAVIKHKPNFKVLFKIFEQCVSENKTVEDFLKTYCKKVLVWD